MRLLPITLLALPALAHADVTRLGWLAGCWSAERGEPGSVEQKGQPRVIHFPMQRMTCAAP